MTRKAILLLTLMAVMSAISSAQDSSPSVERAFPFPQANIQAALQKMGAYQGARLPSLDGFIKTIRAKIENYERPYYEYKIELESHGENQTTVRIKAKVSAWYADPTGANPGYQNFDSNGRLETDLLDRLSDYLSGNKATAGAAPTSLQSQIEDIRRQRRETEKQISALEQQLEELRKGKPAVDPPNFVSIAKSHVPVFRSSEANAPVLLHAQAEDEFEMLEHRGAWIKVKLEGDTSGWVRSSNVRLPMVHLPAISEAATEAATPGFTVIREMVSTFSGDWPRLSGKPALYVWARSEGSSLNVQAGKKLPFAQSIFLRRYREQAHSSGDPVSGIVVIFLDQVGGVAAASMDDIRLLADGSLTPQAFARKCSLDPPTAFASLIPPAAKPVKN